MSGAFLSADGLAPNPLAGIDEAVAERLLGEALASGGDYADLYFEFRCGADFVLEEERVRSVGRALIVGLGVRVLRGDATGYAYTEELSSARMREAARTAGPADDACVQADVHQPRRHRTLLEELLERVEHVAMEALAVGESAR